MKKLVLILLIFLFSITCVFAREGWEGQYFNEHTDQDKAIPADGQVYKWDAAQALWIPATITINGTPINVTSLIVVGNATASWFLGNGSLLTGLPTYINYTDERVDDRVSILIQNGTGITWIYNDTANTFTPTVTITQYTDGQAVSAVLGLSNLTNYYNKTTSDGKYGTSNLTLIDFSASNPITYNNTTGAIGWTNSNNYITLSNISAGAGISYNSTSGQINSTITQYTDALARAALSAGTGLSYNSTTGVFTNSITQYTDALARVAISNTATGLTWTNSTGVLSLTSGYVIPTTTEEANWNGVFSNNHTAVILAGANYLTLSGQQITAGDVALTTNTSGSYVASVATTAPITGGAAGSEGATLTIAIPKGTTSVDGYINATDWTTFNNKLNSSGVIDIGSATSFEIPNAVNPTLGTTGMIAINTADKTLELNNGANQVAIPTIHIAQGTFDLKSQFAVDPDLWLVDLHADTYPHGIYITKVYVDANVADPTTELNANLNYCDATTVAFPGANVVLITTIDTTTGNYANATVNTTIPTGKSIYVTMDADPTDLLTQYHIRMHYYLPTS